MDAFLLVVDGVHVLDELQDLVGIADLVVVPGHDLDEGVGQGDAFVKVVSWYDNEMGYSDKVLCLIEHMYSVDHK